MAINIITLCFNSRPSNTGQSDAMGAYVTQNNAAASIQDMSFLFDRFRELAFICEQTENNDGNVFYAGGRQTVIAAAENFLGHRLCRESVEWKTIKQMLESLSLRYPNILFLPGTAKKYTAKLDSVAGVKGAPACRVMLEGKKLMNVYKAKGAGNVDRFPEAMSWARTKLISGTLWEKNASRSNVFRWGQRKCGVEICNDARSRVLANDAKMPTGGLDIVFWLTNGLFMSEFVGAVNKVPSDNFPCAVNGYIIHASGFGRNNQEVCYPSYQTANTSGAVTQTEHNQALTQNRLYFGVYGPYSNRTNRTWACKPHSYCVLSSTNDLLVRAFVWSNIHI